LIGYNGLGILSLRRIVILEVVHFIFVVLVEVDECWEEENVLGFSFLSRDAHYFLDGRDDVEWLNVLAKVIGFDLSEIEQVLDNKCHQTYRAFLHFHPILKLQYFDQYIINYKISIPGIVIHVLLIQLSKHLLYVLIDILLFYVLRLNRIKWIS
jgi:hypothetical protein